jgi:hypothetical protein
MRSGISAIFMGEHDSRRGVGVRESAGGCVGESAGEFAVAAASLPLPLSLTPSRTPTLSPAPARTRL